MEFVPFCDHDDRISLLCQPVRIFDHHELRHDLPGDIHGNRVIRNYLRAVLDQTPGDVDRRCFAHIIRVWLERKTQQSNLLSFEFTQHFLDALYSHRTAIIIDLHHGVQKLGMASFFFCHIGECLDILGKARSAVTQTSVEEERTNAFIIAHPHGNLLNISTEFFTDVGDLVDEGDFCRQKGVRSVLDHLGGAQVGDHDRCAQREVKLGYFLSSRRIQRAQHGAVWLHKIADRRPLPQEFRTGYNGKGDRFQLVLSHDICHPVASSDWHS